MISLPQTVGIPASIPSTSTVPEPEKGSKSECTGRMEEVIRIRFRLMGLTIMAG